MQNCNTWCSERVRCHGVRNIDSSDIDLLYRWPCVLAWSWKWNTTRLKRYFGMKCSAFYCQGNSTFDLCIYTALVLNFRGAQIIQISRNHLKILGDRTVTWSKLKTDSHKGPGARDLCSPPKLYDRLAFSSYRFGFTCSLWAWNLVSKSENTVLRIMDNKTHWKILDLREIQ
jgi:hypothetical protein